MSSPTTNPKLKTKTLDIGKKVDTNFPNGGDIGYVKLYDGVSMGNGIPGDG
jgi:hypothetical protein